MPTRSPSVDQQRTTDPSGARGALRGVLFDMDGTLVETEQFWGIALAELATRLGGRMSDEARSRTIGTSMSAAMAVLHADLGIERTQAETYADAAWVTDRSAELLAGSIEWRPGARELLVAVRTSGLATALVTTTPRNVAELVLSSVRAELGGEPFDVTVCGDEAPALKPDPAPYRQAMAALRLEPEQCLVIEDSVVGIGAGLAAGVAVLGVPVAQTVAPAPGLTLLDSLLGVDVADLAALHAGRGLATTQA
ncbi:MAG: HAD family hydrolase [Actinomycetes bacterium]